MDLKETEKLIKETKNKRIKETLNKTKAEI